jgi:hypothetical protein
MSEPGEIQFVCIGCGTTNPAGAEVCAGCGYRFAGTDIVSTPRRIDPIDRPRSRPAPLLNPYEPPTPPISPPTTFRIGTILVFTAVVAVCLAMFRADISLGVFVTLMLMPAAIRTPFVAARRRRDRRPMSVGEQVGSFLMTALVTWLTAISGAIGFVATCVPSGLMTQNIAVGLTVGAIGAIACALFIIRFFLKLSRENLAKEREIRYW